MEAELGKLLGLHNQQTGLDLRAGDSDGEFSEPTVRPGKRRHGFETSQTHQRKKSSWEIISEKISELLERTAICPLEGIKSEPCFTSDSQLTNPHNATQVNEAIKLWSYKINSYTLRDFFNMYQKQERTDLIFSRSKRYMSEQESVVVIDTLLKYQFGDEEHRIKEFLQTLVNLLDWQPSDRPGINVKCNTLLVHSPPSAGKNFFFDTIFTLLLNLGQLGTANKSNNFPFQDAAHRRIILWNEPNYEPSFTDYIKTLFEGGDTKVRVKMLGDTHVKRTPIIILTNNIVDFMVDSAFRDRVVQYKWKAAPFLKEFNLKPYPLVFFDILLKYEINF